jgi:hypothetical protein
MLSEALVGWQGVLDRVDDLHHSAETSSEIKPVKNLVPESLIRDEESGNDNARYIDGSKAVSSNELRDINAFSFVGGGASITYVEDGTKTSASTTSAELAFSVSIFLKITKEITIGLLGSSFDSTKMGTLSLKAKKAWGSSDSEKSGRSFTLSDPDYGDSFDVKVSTCRFHIF